MVIDFKRRVCKDGETFALLNQKGIDPLALDMLAKVLLACGGHGGGVGVGGGGRACSHVGCSCSGSNDEFFLFKNSCQVKVYKFKRVYKRFV